MLESRWPAWTIPLLATLLFAASAEAIDLTGETVVLTYELGNTSGTAMATVGPGPEFVIELVPTSPGFSIATIDITADQLTLSHSRSTRLGPGFPVIDDDVLVFEFTGLAIDIGDVVLTADPMPEWFGGLTFTDTTITLDQLLDNAGVNESLKVWTIEELQGDFWGGANWGELVWGGALAVPAIHGIGLFALSALMAGTVARWTKRRGDER